ncbi:hypothetical protein [Gimesia panareensis]|uniref:hypothetical protein n=1 Tax=Gimesia panareensis TaxID=2527978 RepID=UPI001187FF2E|nr:hypothetical protein [Gimesia panareensis]QDU48487.1 hypothetical protein Pan110_08020 [Gimesia panareensis]
MNDLKQQKKRFIYTFLFALFHFVLNPVLLFVGFYVSKLGHGNKGLWYIGIASCLLFNLTLLMTVITSYPLRKIGIARTCVFYICLLLFLAYGTLSFVMTFCPEII